MNKEEYGEKYQDHLIEQYKVLSQSLTAIGARRVDFNKFYLSLLSGLLVIVSLVIDKSIFSQSHNFIFLLISILGISLCGLWQLSVRSFERISKTRYTVLGEMENELPFPSFKKSGDYLHSDSKYVIVARITRYISYLMMLPYSLLLIYTLYQILK